MNVPEMKCSVTEAQKTKCLYFAEVIVTTSNQYNRFNQDIQTQINRTYIGKLAEYVFLQLLQSRGINYPEGDMFEIFDGEQHADDHDFVTSKGEGVDIKTASLPFHKRIMVPESQFHLRKDWYVGIRLNFNNIKNRMIDPLDIDDVTIHGYIDRETLERQPTQHFGEGRCRAYELSRMRPIEELLKRF